MADVYEFRIENRMGTAVQALFAEMSPQVVPSQTTLRGRLADEPGLSETLERLARSGLDVTSARRVPAHPSRR